jgi:putative SOS response-associated peptidase YedK
MCGRFTSLTPPDQVARVFGTPSPAPTLFADFRPDYNVPPTRQIMAVANDREGNRRLGRFSWGLVPSWSPDTKRQGSLINARCETVLEKPSFRNLVPRKRCIIPMDGFFEWRTIDVPPAPAGSRPPKLPVYVTRNDGAMLAVAGLWTSWRDPSAGDDAPWLHTCCVITTEANSTMSPIHDRMPVILEPDSWDEWLDVDRDGHRGTPVPEAVSLLVPAAADVIGAVPVRTDVNSVRNNGPTLIDPIPT